MNKKVKEKGRFLTLVLRHKPEEIGIKLEENGAWANVNDILERIGLTLEELRWIVSNDNKGRFSFNENETKIRANQGHNKALNVNVGIPEKDPGEFLYHGTAIRFLGAIMREGLKPMSRQHVHLSDNLKTAEQVGNRHGKLIVLKIDTKRMIEDGYKFYQSDNGVWLTDKVLPKYIKQN